MNERWKPSVTVAAIASRQRAGRVEYLLVEEETPEGLRLNNPAGHLDPGESPQQAVVREEALRDEARVLVNFGEAPQTFDLLDGEELHLISREGIGVSDRIIELPGMALAVMLSTSEDVEDREVR